MKPRYLSVLVAAVMLAVSCRQAIGSIEQTDLFNLEYGLYDNQLPLAVSEADTMEAHLAMKDGIFYITSSSTGKLMVLSSYGELLQLIYNADKNPKPTLLSSNETGNKASGLQGRIAYVYPFTAPKKIAIDSKQNIYVEDTVPQDRVRMDGDKKIILESVIHKISMNRGYVDYIGQEGIGGTPFSYIQNIQCTDDNELAVITLQDNSYTIYYYDESGKLITSLVISKQNLPQPANEENLLPILDTVIPQTDGTGLFVKVDYFKNILNKEIQTAISMEFKYSVIWKVDRLNGKMMEYYKIDPFQYPLSTNKGAVVHKRSWSLAGYARGLLFLYGITDDGETIYALYNCDSGKMTFYNLELDSQKLIFADFYIASDGIVCALLCSDKTSKIVWWRFDRLFEGIR